MDRVRVKERIKKCIKPFYNGGKMVGYSALGLLNEKGICLNKNSKKLFPYQGLHSGGRCFLIGTGPSLVVEDLELIKGEYSIGCNMLYKLYDKTSWRPNYHCMIDRLYAKYESEAVSANVDVPFFTPYSTYRRMKVRPEHTIYVHDIYKDGLNRARGRMLSYCWINASVMLFMMDLAFYMGFKEVYLLGVDCTNVHEGKGHFTTDYTRPEVDKGDQERITSALRKRAVSKAELGDYHFQRQIKGYEEVDTFAKKHGIKIYNATRGGNLEVFERVALENVV